MIEMMDQGKNMTLTQERLKQVVSFEPTTGVFTRILKAKRAVIGRELGYKKSNGYIALSIDGQKYFAHRLAWLYVYGEFPKHDVDHIDGDRANNKIENLRDVTRSVNLQNLKAAKSHNKSTGVLGAYLHISGKFMSRIQVNKKDVYLGLFETAEQAQQAYLTAKQQFHKGYVA